VIRSVSVLTLVVLVAVASAYAAVVPIEDIKLVDSNGEILLNLIGEVFTVTGVVTVPSGTLSSTDLDIYIQDGTGGINIFRAGAKDLRLELGDSVVVAGRLNQGRSGTVGNTYLNLEDPEDLEVVGRGAVPLPKVVTGLEIGGKFKPPQWPAVEPYEGVLVTVRGADFAPEDWPGEGTSKDIPASDATGGFTIRVNKDTDIDGSEVPRLPSIVSGVVIQDSRYPYLSGYKIWPRARYEDFLAMGNGSGTASLDPNVVDTDTESFDLAVTITGNSSDTITAFSIDLPLADGWVWESTSGNVELSGPGLAAATYEVTALGVTVGSAVISGAETFGRVLLKGVSSPSELTESSVMIKTSVDGTGFDAQRL
jgi:hypothetical protein